ncbi:hypothetical protein P153DRAFT_123197 [Dothidotthia symphoricarpi CBS 119687]|uniref:Uncharacterized protein n=1 Tax=Dothidotthia symphoricarpi CBS 119687 TaxID=1392245 RepID=A0A6A6A1L7_9PLEO|nr:uncharacterized protein P153DRAFT_123197 [Dothidotthia symphoricarpi CBS 119687]KAF2124618.1 hypothetical protein P153DRAFT_123197 [Dothidotthia symphoricarpi CBS 119687]
MFFPFFYCNSDFDSPAIDHQNDHSDADCFLEKADHHTAECTENRYEHIYFSHSTRPDKHADRPDDSYLTYNLDDHCKRHINNRV